MSLFMGSMSVPRRVELKGQGPSLCYILSTAGNTKIGSGAYFHERDVITTLLVWAELGTACMQLIYVSLIVFPHPRVIS